jgi:hypothetical protein
MKSMPRKLMTISAASISAAALVLIVGLGMPPGARADDAYAKSQLKVMSDYLAAQKAISFGYDTNYEVVTKEQQKLALASSGTLTLNRPDKIRVARRVRDVSAFDRCSQNANRYTQVDVPGTLDHLVDELREKFNRPLPGADLLLSNVYDVLMPDVIDAKDLGSGVIGGVECDHLAFRTKEVDWQIWIAQGDRPYPCRYVITTKLVDQAPQYSIQIKDWKAGNAVASENFSFTNPTSAKKVDIKDLPDADDLPKHFVTGGTQ